MILLVVLLLIAAPILELLVAAAVADQVGLGPTLLTVLAAAVLGVFVMRAAWRRRPRTPDTALLWTAGLLLLLPGFVSDVIGLLLLVPPVRAVVRVWIGLRVERRLDAWNVQILRWRSMSQENVVQGEVIRDDGGEGEPDGRPPLPPPTRPPR